MQTTHLDDLVGLDIGTQSQSAEAADLFDTAIVATARRLAATPPRLESFIAGLALDGTLRRPALQSALAPFMTMPKPEPRTRVRARMAAEIARAYSSNGCVTEEDLKGFTREEIAELFTEARRISGVAEMVA